MAYSLHYQELDEEEKAQYREKLAVLGGIDDPYKKTSRSTVGNLDWQQWPEVQYPDIFNYLIATTSSYTQEDI